MRSWLLTVAVLLATLVLSLDTSEAAGSFNVYTMHLANGMVRSTSLALDASGNPIVAFSTDGFFDDLHVMRCNDPDCAGGDESITSPDTAGDVGAYISMVLDASGNPVVSYQDVTNEDLKVMHCNDPACSGGDESITAPQTTGQFGYRTSIVLDSLGRPVIVHQAFSDDLRIVHCNDVNCAGANESVASPDPSSTITAASAQSVAVDASNYPVVAYYDYGLMRLKVLHCNDINCVGGGESVTMPEPIPFAGYHSSIVLDGAGLPVVAYREQTQARVMHCNDANCSGGNESIVTIGELDDNGDNPYLQLDSSGYPVIVHIGPAPGTGGVPYVIHCNDANCAGADDPVTLPLTYDNHYPSRFQLDSLGRPVLATSHYFRIGLLHCVDAYCSPDSDGDSCADAQEQLSLSEDWEFRGGNRSPKDPFDYFNPSHDGVNRVDDILLVVNQYFDDDSDGNPGLPLYAPGYTPDTDRTLVGPESWNVGAPNGLQRVDDILNMVNHYFHDCS